MDHFSELPDEMILKIFGYLEHSELTNCLCVCRKWYRLASDDSLWYEVCTSWHRMVHNDQLLFSIVRQHPNISSLVIVSKPNVFYDPELCSVLKSSDVWNHFEKLTRLTLYKCPPLFFGLIPDILSACHKTLTCFCCEGSTKLQSEELQHLFANPSVQYRELNIAHCSSIGDLAVFQAQQSSHFSTCLQKLELLNLDGVGTVERLTDAGMIVLLTACPLLKSLSCDGELMTDDSSEYIQRLPRLEHLSISFCTELTDKSLQCFSKLQNLMSLHLRKGNEFTNQGFELLFGGLCSKDLPQHYSSARTHNAGSVGVGKLKKLCLVECRLLRDSGLIKLAQSFPHLVYLDLSWCWNLSDIGLEAVAHHCHRIETLKLVGLRKAMCVPVQGVSLPRLRYLDLEQSDLVNDNELKKFKETKPWIKIVDYYGEEVKSD